MIVSHRHRFVFLKTRKTAGTSIEVALARIAGDDAIVTPLNPPEPGHEPRNYGVAGGRQAGGGEVRSLRRLIRDPDAATAAADRIPYFNHMPAFLVRAKLGAEVWESYFRFCFERNPWEKVASMYWWRTRGLAAPPHFSDWLHRSDRVFSDWPIYSIDDACAVTAVGRYEALSADLAAFARRAGVALDAGALPRAKGGFRRAGALYSAQDAGHVRGLFAREVEWFGYECPPRLLI